MNINEVKFEELFSEVFAAFSGCLVESWEYGLANKEKFICCYECWKFCTAKLKFGVLELLGIMLCGIMMLLNNVKGWMSYNNYSHREKCTNFAHFLNAWDNLRDFAEYWGIAGEKKLLFKFRLLFYYFFTGLRDYLGINGFPNKLLISWFRQKFN